MAKISQVSAKYIVQSTIDIEGVVDRPDVIGAIFGQTEGLLGSDLELRELQRSGRIGRIEVNLETKGGKTKGTIIIPSSLDKAETSIVGAALEIIERIGPCNAKLRVQKIEDVRVAKRDQVIARAKELLRTMKDTVLPDSQELADEVSYSVRVMEVQDYGPDKLPAGPAIDDSEEIIIVEGRADVITLLKHGFKNVISMNGTSVPKTIIELTKKKTSVAFVDGDRGGDLNIQELLAVAELDFVTKAPDGKEVEELTKKEIHKALRGRIAAEQAKLDFASPRRTSSTPRPSLPRPGPRSPAPRQPFQRGSPRQRPQTMRTPVSPRPVRRARSMTEQEAKTFKQMVEDLLGTRGAYLLDQKLNILGKVPLAELISTMNSLGSGVYALVLDGSADSDLVSVAEKGNVQFVICMDSTVKDARLTIKTAEQLE